MHSGFTALRSALPMNLKARYDNFRIWARAQADIDRITTIWRECLGTYRGPYLFGEKVCMADAMFAPVATRFRTYGVALDEECAAYSERILALPPVQQWVAAAQLEPEQINELESEF
jgi:glutathione S-transferase